MQIEDRGIICDTGARPETERVASFTSLCAASSGSIFSACQVGPGKNAASSTLLLFRSPDRGGTWREVPVRFATKVDGIPGSLGCAEMVEASPGLLLLVATWFDRSDPRRPLFDPVTEGILHSRQLAAFSTDDGNSWSPWRPLGVGDLAGCSATGPILRWPDGAIAYAFESYKEFDDPRPGAHGAWCLVSRDQGRTFGRPFLVAQDPGHKIYYWDQRLCVGRLPGEFTALFWTHDLATKQDLNVHFRHGRLAEDRLACGPIADTGIPGQIAAPLWLEDGRLLAFVVNRGRPGTLTLWSSRDRGVTWSEKLVVYVHDECAALSQGAKNVDFAQYWEDMTKWSFGHPAVRSLGGGRVLLAYYAGAPNCMSTHWARVRIDA